ncbi:hypothetical protein L6R53_17045 [Myxococcota bacterium]|nr:hypothetical protein [Myxococcota bacterium]
MSGRDEAARQGGLEEAPGVEGLSDLCGGALSPGSQADLLAALQGLPEPVTASVPAGLVLLALVERRGEPAAWTAGALFAAVALLGAAGAGPVSPGLACLLLVVGPGLGGAGLAAALARWGRVATSRGLLVLLSVAPALLASQVGCPADGWLHALLVHLGATLVLALALRGRGRRPRPA